MNTVLQQINEWLSNKKTAILDNYEKMNFRASGKFEDDLETKVEQEDNNYKIQILGSAHTYFMENGRQPNKNQSPEAIKAFVGFAGSTFLADWVNNKGLTINPFAVAHVIATEGTKHKEPIISSVINDESINELLEHLSVKLINEVKSDVLKNYANATDT